MAGKINVTYEKTDLINLILNDLKMKMPNVAFVEGDISIQVKSTQNYKSEWESAQFKAEISKREWS